MINASCQGGFFLDAVLLFVTLSNSLLEDALPAGETILPDAASFYDGLAVQRMLDAARKSHVEQTWVRL